MITLESTSPKTNSELIHQVLLLLKKYSLISYDGETSIFIHRLIQKVARRSNSIFVKFILNAMCKHDLTKKEVRQVVSIWELADADTIKQYSNYPIRIFSKMYEHSMVLEMKPFAEKNYQLLTHFLGPNHKDTLGIQRFVAHALSENGDYDGALAKYTELLEKQNRILDEDSIEILATTGSIASILGTLEKYNESIQWYKQLLQSQLRLFGNDKLTMITRNNLALVFVKVGRVNEALYQYNEVLGFCKNSSGDAHDLFLTVRHNMAIILFNQGRYDEAKTEFESVLSVRLELYGEEHVLTVDSQYLLAVALWALGRLEEALTMMGEVLELRQKILGVNHATTQLTRDKMYILKNHIKYVVMICVSIIMLGVLLVVRAANTFKSRIIKSTKH